MSRRSRHSAAEKLAILKELETGQTSLVNISEKYGIGMTALYT